MEVIDLDLIAEVSRLRIELKKSQEQSITLLGDLIERVEESQKMAAELRVAYADLREAYEEIQRQRGMIR